MQTPTGTLTREIVSYAGWNDCVRLSNGSMELIITTAVGPRILRCAFVGGSNLFAEFAADLGRTGDPEWRPYGGHRLWHAPESVPRTYFPDNGPVEHSWDGSTLTLRQPVETTTGIAKEMRIALSSSSNRVTVVHRLTNTNLWEIQTAPWCLSVMAPGGRAILPQEPFVPFPDQLLPARPLVLWSYTDMSDPRFTWGPRFIRIRQDADRPAPQKIGLRNTLGWGAYVRGGELFLKHAPFDRAGTYPDFGCNWEVYTNADMLEMETLGPLTRLPAEGGSVEHTETWLLERLDLGESEGEIEKQMAAVLAKL